MDSRGRILRFGVFYAVLYGAVAVIYPFIPIYFHLRGFSPSRIGLLLGAVEISGMLAPLLVSEAADRGGHFRGVLGALSALAAFSVVLMDRAAAPAGIFAASVALGFFLRPIPPLTDALTGRVLADSARNYGRVRVWGTFSFILLSLILQITGVLGNGGSRRLAAAFVLALGAVFLTLPGVPGTSAHQALPDPSSRPRSLSGLGLGTNFCPFYLLRRWQNTHLAHAKLRFCRLASGTEGETRSLRHQKSSDKPQIRQTPNRPGPSRRSPIPGDFFVFLAFCFFGNLGFAAYRSFGSLYFSELFGLPAVSGLMALASASEIPAMIFGGRLLGRFGHRKIFAAALAAIILRLLVLSGASRILPIALSQLTHAFTYGFFLIAGVDWVNRRVPEDRRALGMSLFSATSFGASILAAGIVGGFLVEHGGFSRLFSAAALVTAFPLLAVSLRWFGESTE